MALGRITSTKTCLYLGNFLLWVGVPITIISFLRGTDLSGLLWVAPLIAWIAIFLGIGFAWIWIRWQGSKDRWQRSTQGSFLLTSMVGNTGYLGYPVVLALVGPDQFAWALFYDLLGTTLGAYGLGIGIAAWYGIGSPDKWSFVGQLLRNPPLWSLLLGLGLHSVSLPAIADQVLQQLAWIMIGLSLILLGMRLGQLTSWSSISKAASSLSIKMLLVPLLLGAGLSMVGIEGPVRLALVLQMAMPPAFATLVITEVYHLDQDLTVTALAVGSVGLLGTLPIWIWLFG